MSFPITLTEVPYVAADQMIEVDRAMIKDYGIELIQMMENAGRNLAHLARERFFLSDPVGRKVAVPVRLQPEIRRSISLHVHRCLPVTCGQMPRTGEGQHRTPGCAARRASRPRSSVAACR